MEHNFESATGMLCLHMSSDLFYRMRGDARRWPIREERFLTGIVSLLKAWKVTVVWVECHDAVF